MSGKVEDIKQSKFGFVCMLDALGTKEKYKNNPSEYIRIMGDIKTNVENKKKSDGTNKFNIPLDFLFMSDTVVIISESNETSADFSILDIFLKYCLEFFMEGFKNNIYYRGVISKGSICKNDYFYIGSAIDDAIPFYEKTDWMGVVLTQAVSYLQLYNPLKDNLNKLLQPAIAFQDSNGKGLIPFKMNVCSDELLVLNWPSCYAISKFHEYGINIDKKAIDFKDDLYYKFSENNIRSEAISKFNNTIRFYEYWAEKFDKNQSARFQLQDIFFNDSPINKV